MVKRSVWAGLVLLGILSAPTAAGAQELLEELVPDPYGNHKGYGQRVAVDGDTLVMGDYNYMMEGNCGQQEHGAIQVFKKVGSQWQKTEFFRYLNDTTDTQRHGWSVAIKGNVIVAATPGQQWDNGTEVRRLVGALSVYKRPNGNSPFAFSGQVFLPDPEPYDLLGWPVDMASNGEYAVAVSSEHRTLMRIFRVHPTLEYLTTVTFPDGGNPWRMFITNQNILVAATTTFQRPLAWKLNGSQTPVELDTSALGGPGDSISQNMTGDGDSIAWFVSEGLTGAYVLRTAKFGANSVLFTNSVYPPQGGGWPLTMKEDQALFFSVGSGSIASFKNVGGSFRFQGNLYQPSLYPLSAAFNGTDLIVGEGSTEHWSNSICGYTHGSLWVHRPMAPSAPGPGLSTMLQPWMHSSVSHDGATVAMSGSFAVSGAPDTYQGDYFPAGGVMVHQNVNGAWQQVEQYTDIYGADRGAAWTGFGSAVDVNSGFLVIGAPWGLNMYGYQTGTVQYVKKSNGQYLSGPYMDEIEPPSFDEFGEGFGNAVALSANTMLIGAPGWFSPPESPTAGGSVYVFEWDGWGWWYRQRLRSTTQQTYEGFGQRVAASGDGLIVGMPYRSSNGWTNNGAVQIFQKDPTTGSYQSAGEFSAPAELGDWSYFGDTVTIGTDFAAAGSYAGSVVVYRRNGTSWSQERILSNGQFGFGASLAIEGWNLVVGSPGENSVHRYQRSTWWGVGYWSRTGTLVGPTTYSFGVSADMENGLVSVGDAFATVGGRSAGADFMLNFSNIQ